MCHFSQCETFPRYRKVFKRRSMAMTRQMSSHTQGRRHLQSSLVSCKPRCDPAFSSFLPHMQCLPGCCVIVLFSYLLLCYFLQLDQTPIATFSPVEKRNSFTKHLFTISRLLVFESIMTFPSAPHLSWGIYPTPSFLTVIVAMEIVVV